MTKTKSIQKDTSRSGAAKARAVKARTGKIKKSASWEALAKELKGLIPRLDEEGLAFLTEQAQIHLYNMQVDVLNQTMIRPIERAGKAPAGRSKNGKTAAETGFSEIKTSESGSSYYVIYKNEWIMFSKEEMLLLLKIAGGEGTELEIKERLYNWFARERSDLLRSAGIAEKFDPKLTSLAKLLKKTFKVRKQK